MKGIVEHINESREEIYSVAFSGVNDKDGLPATVKVHVPREYAKAFENFLDRESGNTVVHACGNTNNYELDF